MMVQPFVENAILHGLSSERNDGLIEIHFTKVYNELQILVRDNGQGIRKNGRQKLNSQNPLKDKYYKSVGITITKKRLELLQLGNKVTVKNLEDNQGEISGAEVLIRMSI